MIRANVALGLSADGPYEIMPGAASTDIQSPSRAIFYDTGRALGYVVPWDHFQNMNLRMRIIDRSPR